MFCYRTVLYLLFCHFPFLLLAQLTSSSEATVFEATSFEPPREVDASDGIYPRFVLLRWEASSRPVGYKIFRANDEKGNGLQQLSKDIQKSTWFCDYTAVPGVEYFYAVATADKHSNTSPLSQFDKGYIQHIKVADQDRLLSENSAITSPAQRFLLISNASTNQTTYAAGESVEIEVELQNIFTQETPRTELRYYLSKDAHLHWNDGLLLTKTYSALPGEKSFTLSNSFQLPDQLIKGTYFIIIVAAPEGKVIHSKIGTAIINVK